MDTLKTGMKDTLEWEVTERLTTPRGEFRGDANEGFLAPFEIGTGKPVNDLWIVLLPTTKGWEVPAYMAFGGWNSCPGPDVHVAVLRSWHERFGAEPVTMTHDVLELTVVRRPASRELAVELALEQYRYCEDIVTQGVGTVDALAASAGLRLIDDVALPANNHCRVWLRR